MHFIPCIPLFAQELKAVYKPFLNKISVKIERQRILSELQWLDLNFTLTAVKSAQFYLARTNQEHRWWEAPPTCQDIIM